ncbi:hypothetical protein H4S02_007246 [Coemansia sp. RSA 2611]|nr:hypothetical protein H4S01_006598 [Coemansia sp. RSA 2610]KAJ2378900.1 hypothetical protein H4S02_007246 [Coemansia sp. RSA 2611]
MLRVFQSFSALTIGQRAPAALRAFSVGGASLAAAAKAKKPATKGRKPAAKKKAKPAKAKQPAKSPGRPKRKQPTQVEQLEAKLNSKKALLKGPKSRGPSSYAVFLADNAKTTGPLGPGGVAEIARDTSAKWSRLSDHDKQAYRAKAGKLAEAHQETLRQWWSTVDLRLVALENRRRKRVDGSKAKLLVDPFAPKRPQTAYVLFASEYIKQNYTGGIGREQMGALMKSAAAQWKSLAEAEKAAYVKAADVERARYKADMEKHLKSHTAGGLSH